MDFFQKVTEKVTGSRIKDIDYEATNRQMFDIETGIINLKTILRNYKETTEPLKKMIKSLNDTLTLIYNNSPFEDFIEDVKAKNEIIIKVVESINRNVAKLYSKTTDWEKIFEKAKEYRKVRVEKQKVFEHYEQKLRAITDGTRIKKDSDKFKRNEEKYTVAMNDYISSCEKSYELIIDSMKLGWDLLNPTLGNFMVFQRIFYENVADRFSSFNELTKELKEIKDKAFDKDNINPNYNYDAKKFIVDKGLMKKMLPAQIIEQKSSNEVNFGGVKLFAKHANSFGKNTDKNRENIFISIPDELGL